MAGADILVPGRGVSLFVCTGHTHCQSQMHDPAMDELAACSVRRIEGDCGQRTQQQNKTDICRWEAQRAGKDVKRIRSRVLDVFKATLPAKGRRE